MTTEAAAIAHLKSHNERGWDELSRVRLEAVA